MTDTPRHLGFRIAVGVAGLALLILFILLGRATQRHADTLDALETRNAHQEPDPVGSATDLKP